MRFEVLVVRLCLRFVERILKNSMFFVIFFKIYIVFKIYKFLYSINGIYIV